jgi:hypothetical protein
MMMLGSYSYLNGNEKCFSYTTTVTTVATTGVAEQCETHHFAIHPVDEDIAVLCFFTDGCFATGGPGGGLRCTFEGCFFLNWMCSYKLCHAG